MAIVDQTIIARGGTVSSLNSTSANLAAGATFTGTAEEVFEYSTITVAVFSSHASATNGLSMQQSSDGTNWDLGDIYTIAANTGKTFSFAVGAKYFRLVYTNGGTLTTSLRIQTIYNKNDKKASSIRPQDSRPNDNDMMEVVAYGAAYNSATDSWDRLRTSNDPGIATAGATGILVVANGPGFNIEGTASLGNAAGASISFPVRGTSTVVWYFVNGTTFSSIFEATVDGVNWFTHPNILKTSSASSGDLWVTGTVTGATGDTFRMNSNSFKSVRIRTVNTGGATLSVFYVASMAPTVMKVQELRPAPHLIGYTIVKKTVEFTSAQTGATVWQPASGKMIAVTDFNITTGGLTAGLVTLWCGTAGDTTYTAGTDETVFRGEFAPGTASRPGAIKTYDVPWICSTANNVLRFTSSANMTVYVQVNGYEF